MSANRSVQYRTDSNILELLSGKIYNRSTGPLVELAKNSCDAAATDINIAFVRGRHPSIVLEDNGEGMGFEGIQNFYTIGASDKAQGSRVNSRGLPVIGRYGVGNTGLYKMGTQHVLTTIDTEGMERIVSVNFEDLLGAGVDWAKYQHEVEERQDRRKNSGTTIEVSGLKDGYSASRFTALESQLKKALGRELKGRLNNTTIRVNGQRVESYIDALLRDADEQNLRFEVRDPETGKKYQAKGKIWISETSLDPQDSGVFPIISGANPIFDGHQYGAMPMGWGRLRDRIFAEVEADFLEDKLNLSRDSFVNMDTDPLIKAFYGEVNKQLRGVLSKHDKIVKKRQSQADLVLQDHLALSVSRLFKAGLEGIMDEEPIVAPSSRGRTEGVRGRKWNAGAGNKKPSGQSTSNPTPTPRTKTVGTRQIDMGGAMKVRLRFTSMDGKPAVFMDGVGGDNPEVVINKESNLYQLAARGGSDGIWTAVGPQLIQAVSAYRLGLEGETSFDAVNELANERIEEFSRMKVPKIDEGE